MHKQNFGKMKLINLLFGLFIILIIFTSCSNDSEDEISCELKLKILDSQDNNLVETGFYNSDTVFIYQENLETKSNFDYDNIESTLSISTSVFNVDNMDNDFLLYLNHMDTDTLKIDYERDPTVPCLGGLVLKGVIHNGQELTKQGDIYIIEK